MDYELQGASATIFNRPPFAYAQEICSKKRRITVAARRISISSWKSLFSRPGSRIAMHRSWYSSAVFGGTEFVECERCRAAMARHAYNRRGHKGARSTTSPAKCCSWSQTSSYPLVSHSPSFLHRRQGWNGGIRNTHVPSVFRNRRRRKASLKSLNF